MSCLLTSVVSVDPAIFPWSKFREVEPFTFIFV